MGDLVHSASGSVPVGLGDKPWLLTGDRYSKNLAAWSAKNQFANIPLHVFRDSEKTLRIGWLDELDRFIGSRLWQVLSLGRRAEAYAYDVEPDLTVLADFWDRYRQIGVCAIDTAHNYYDSAARYEEGDDRRTCKWCGQRQVLRRWTETISRQAWEAEQSA